MILFLLTCSAALAFSVGNILEKLGLSATREKNQGSSLFSFVKRIVINVPWLAGIGLSAYGTIAYYSAMAQWELTLVQPLMTLNPILTAIMGKFWLKEHLDKRTLKAIIWNTIGLLLVASQVSSKHNLSVDAVNYWMFSAVITVLCVLSVVMRPGHFEFRDGMITGCGFGVASVLFKVLSQKVEWSRVSAFEWDAIAEVLAMPLFWGYAISYTIGFVFSQVALSRGRALFVIPFSAALGTFLPILGGWLVFSEKVIDLQWVSFGCLMVAAVYFVRSGQKTSSKLMPS